MYFLKAFAIGRIRTADLGVIYSSPKLVYLLASDDCVKAE